MIGRGRNKLKRFDLGILSIEYIKNQIPDIKLMIVSKSLQMDNLKHTIENLNLENNVVFSNYSSDPSIYYKDASLNFITSVSESYSLVLSETKIYGIPNILLGLDYLSLAKKGTIIIYDDSPESLAKHSIKILHDKIYKKKLSKLARTSMKKFNNENIFKKWKILLLSVANDYKNYTKYFETKKKNTKNLYKILKRQTFLLNKRMPNINNITISDLENLPYIDINKKINRN